MRPSLPRLSTCHRDGRLATDVSPANEEVPQGAGKDEQQHGAPLRHVRYADFRLSQWVISAKVLRKDHKHDPKQSRFFTWILTGGAERKRARLSAVQCV